MGAFRGRIDELELGTVSYGGLLGRSRYKDMYLLLKK